MNQFIENLYNQMIETLQHALIGQENILLQAEQACQVAETSLRTLRDFILSNIFRDQEEEIRFFKEEKPLFLKEFIYYAELFYVESTLPAGSKEIQIAHFEQNLERIHIYFQRNNYLYTYYRTGKTYLDHVFFLHNAEDIPLQPSYSFDLDPRFSTVCSFKLSKLMAFEELHDYLQASICRLEDTSPADIQPKLAKSITWTAPKAALIELAYALQSSGVFDFGRTDVKQVVLALENSFNIKAGNFYRVFQGQRIRKKSRTSFLDALKENLIKRMDETDINPKVL